MAVRALRTSRYVPEATRRAQPLLVLLSDAFDKSLLQEIDLTIDRIPIESIYSNTTDKRGGSLQIAFEKFLPVVAFI